MDLAESPADRRRARAVAAVLAKAARLPEDTGRSRVARGARWRLLAATGLLGSTDGTDGTDGGPEVDVLVAEATARELPTTPYAEAMFAADLVAWDPGSVAAIRAGRTGAVVALDEGVTATPGSAPGRLAPVDPAAPVLSGTLRHVTGAARTDLLVVVTPAPADGVVISLLPAGTDGVAVDGGPAGTVRFSGAHPARSATLDRDRWARVLAAARVRLALYLVGVADTALTSAERHAMRRTQFGAPIATFQGVAFPLAALAARVEGARMLSRYAASVVARPVPLADVARVAAQALACAATVAKDVTARSVHVHGSAGMTDRTPVAALHHRARAAAAALGTPSALVRAAGAAIAAADGVPLRFYGEGD